MSSDPVYEVRDAADQGHEPLPSRIFGMNPFSGSVQFSDCYSLPSGIIALSGSRR